MSASGRPSKRRRSNPLLAERLERLRLQAMASELAGVVGRNIAAARTEKGIGTQRELAALLSKEDPEMAPSNTRVSVWERGEEKPGDRYMRSLVKVLDKSTDWFYTDHQKPDKSETPDPFAAEAATQQDRIEELAGQLTQLDRKLDRVLAAVEAQPDLKQEIHRAFEDYASRLGERIGKLPPQSKRSQGHRDATAPTAA